MKAYCEPGCKNYQCSAGDVHVYRHDDRDEWLVHVRDSRPNYPEPLPEPPAYTEGDSGYISALGKYYSKVFDLTRRATPVPIGGPYDGTILPSPSPLACAVVLDGLRSDGYIVPERITAALREEASQPA